MSNVTITPNMSLPVPNVGLDPGPDYASNINSCLFILDQHNHSSGSGALINPSSLNINSDLLINGNNITIARSIRFDPQASPLALSTDLGCVYVSGVDLWFNDVNGVQIQITSGGAVLASSSGISSGTNTASFISNVLVVNAAPNTPANIQAGSILLGNNIAGSFFLTLSPPSAMGANFQIVLPNLPGTLSVVTLDVAGNMGTLTFDQVGQGMTSTGANAIAASITVVPTSLADAVGTAMSSTGSNAVAASRTRSTGAVVGIGGVAVSPSCGNFTNGAAVLVNVTNLSVTIDTSGRPVFFTLMSSNPPVAVASFIGAASGGFSLMIAVVLRDGIPIYTTSLADASTTIRVPPASISGVDVVSAGTHTYVVQTQSGGGGTSIFNEILLVAYEL